MKKQLLLVLACGWASLSFAASQIFVKTPENGGNDVNSGESWEAAKATIGAALSAVDANGTVTVGPGTYTVTCSGTTEFADAGVVLANGVKLISSKGPEETIITQAEGAGASSTVVSLTGGAVMSGFAISDFVAWGVYFDTNDKSKNTTMTNCIVRNMRATATATVSAVRISNANSKVTDCVISNNIITAASKTEFRGAGVFVNGLLYRSRIVDNHIVAGKAVACSAGSAAGVYQGGGNTRGCLIVGNTTISDGCAVRLTKGSVDNCTIAGNTTASATIPGGLYINGNPGTAGHHYVRNCIIYGNTQSNYKDDKGVAVVVSTCCTPLITGEGCEGNTDSSPNFNADWTIGSGTKCVDCGVYQSWMAGQTDLAGNDRIINEVVDMGCFERPLSSEMEVTFSILPVSRLAPLDATLTASVVGGTGEGRVYKWEFNDPEIEDAEGAEYASVERTFGMGTYTVKLTVTEGTSSADYTESFTVYPGTVFVDPKGSNEPPYATKQTAAHSIADAIAAAAEGAQVVIADGTYVLAETLVIDKTITVGSESGDAAKVTLTADGGAFRVVELAAAGTLLHGVTVTGATEGGVLISAVATISNCVVTANACSGSYGAGVYSKNAGVITDCRITDNESTYSGQGFAVYLGEYSGCAIRNSVITGNRVTANESIGGAVSSIESATIRNTLIARNVSSKTPAGVSCQRGVTLTNCTILDNVCSVHSKYSCGINTYFPNDNHSLTLVNCIVSGNTNAGEASDIGLGSPSYNKLTATTSLVGNLPDGFTADDYTTEHVGCDPKIYRTASKYGRLKFGSPAVDAGTNQDWMTDAKDVFGKTRIFNETVDVGADELCETTPPGLMLLLR